MRRAGRAEAGITTSMPIALPTARNPSLGMQTKRGVIELLIFMWPSASARKLRA